MRAKTFPSLRSLSFAYFVLFAGIVREAAMLRQLSVPFEDSPLQNPSRYCDPRQNPPQQTTRDKHKKLNITPVVRRTRGDSH